jgi:hypothetical protein
MPSRILAQSTVLTRVRIAALLFLGILLTSGLVGTTWAATPGGIPWQVGDVVVCFGSGSCNVLRIHADNSVQLLDTLSDGLLPGNTAGVALNNSLHVLATDDQGGGSSKVVVYSIASINPFTGTPPLTHSVISTFDASSGLSPSAAAIAVNSAGHIFVGNSSAGGASIVELDGHVPPVTVNVFPFPTTGPCATTTLGSLDIGANADFIYVTANTANDGVIRKVSLPLSPTSSCSQFANFGSGVTLYGIKDIPAGALANVSPNCNGTTCPTDETILVVASGFTDPDSGESEGTGPDPDAVNICTNTPGQPLVSCALLLDTAGAGLTAPLWVPNNPYATGTPILDPHSHVQTVLTSGTSGVDEPPFNQTGSTTIDNAVKWTDIAQPMWHFNNAYVVGALPGPTVAAVPNTYFVDPNRNLQTVTGAGTSGPNPPTWALSGTTTDGLVWTDQGPTVNWAATQPFVLNSFLVDSNNNLQKVATPGTSTNPSHPTWNLTTGNTTIDGLVWADQGQKKWAATTAYALSEIVIDPAHHVQKATTAGMSAATEPSPWNDSSPPFGGTTTDGLKWTDQGQKPWLQNHPYNFGDVIVDAAGHVQKVSMAGTSGPNTPSFADTPPSGGATVVDGLQWSRVGPGDPNQFPDWMPSTPYAMSASFEDPTTNDIWQAVTAGTSGGSRPMFYVGGSPAPQPVADNAVVWTDQGTWIANTPYSVAAQVGDTNFHLFQATIAGRSGVSSPNFIAAEGGSVYDNAVTWTDLGAWQANHTYAVNDPVGDSNFHLQQATEAGTSGAGPTPPSFNDGLNATTLDNAVIWTNQGGPVQSWSAGHLFSLGTFIAEGSPSQHVQKVTEAGTSGSGSPLFKHDGTTIIDNAVTWTESQPSRAATQAYVLNSIVLDTFSPTPHVQQVSLAGTTGPAATFAFSDSGATEIDGLQWTDQPMPSVLARYPVANVTTLQSLALDPLVANCTLNGCPTLPLPARKVTNTNPPVAASFWLGDFGSPTIYRQNFAGGTPTSFPAGAGASQVQSLVVYGGEGANQPGLASLVLNGSLNLCSLPCSPFTATAQFLQNTITSTLYSNSAGSPIPQTISLYASLVDKTSCFNDTSAGNLPCRPTVLTDTNKALVWKLDVPLNGPVALPTSETLNSSFATTFTAPIPPIPNFGIDASTDVFVDEQFDDTTFVGTDPGTRSISVHSLHEVPFTASQTQTPTCTYSSPQNVSYKTNRGTLNFIFTCPGLNNQTQFQHMHPTLSLVKKNSGQSPQFIRLSGTNGKAPYRFDSSGNFWTFQWNLNGATAGVYEGTTFDSPSTPFDSPAVQSFTVTFCLNTSPCPSPH